jgi:putative flippase GtrA
MFEVELARLLRFLFTGVANTAMTGALLVLIASQVSIVVAYTIVYVLGLAFTTVVTARFVFRSQLTVGGGARFVAWYLSVYLLGVSVVRAAAHHWHASHLLSAMAVVAVTAPLNFLGASFVFRSGRTTLTRDDVG